MAKSKSIVNKAMAAFKKPAVPPKALPVTLLSGFLGSGKTTLLQHILRSDHGLRIAVIVNDIGAVNVDANLIKSTHRLTKTQEKVIALQNGCICCTLRGDLLEELVRLSELAKFDYVIVESSGISEPEQVAETFDARLAEQMDTVGEGLDAGLVEVLEKLKAAGGLEKFARLDTTVTVLDAFTVYNDFETDELLSSRRDDVVPEDERTVSDLLVDQIEFADVIVLNKIDLVPAETKQNMRGLIERLNHRAKIIESSYGKIDVKQIVNTGMFNLEVAQTGYGWLQDLHEMTLRQVDGRWKVTPKPETEEYNVRNFVYTRRRPFHPRRLFELLHDKFILQHQFPEEEDDEEEDQDDAMSTSSEEEEEELADHSSPATSATSDADPKKPSAATEGPEIPDNQVILRNKREHPLLRRLFRSKGEFWLATRPGHAGDWSQAGTMLTLQGGRPWFCCTTREEWETGDAQIDKLVEHDIGQGGEWGDRRQEIVFIGEALDVQGIEGLLDACLVSDEEWHVVQRIMRKAQSGKVDQEALEERLADEFEDGFPDWDFGEADGMEIDGGDAHAGHSHAGHSHAGHSHAAGKVKPKHRITKDGVVA